MAADYSAAAASGASLLTAAQLQPFVEWAMTRFHGPTPENASLVIAAALVVAVHALYIRITQPKESKP